MTRAYNRSEILSFWDLTDTQQIEALDHANDREHAESISYVELEGTALPLDMFMRTEHSKFWDGIYGTSYFSAYFIKLSKCGSMAVVADRYF